MLLCNRTTERCFEYHLRSALLCCWSIERKKQRGRSKEKEAKRKKQRERSKENEAKRKKQREISKEKDEKRKKQRERSKWKE